MGLQYFVSLLLPFLTEAANNGEPSTPPTRNHSLLDDSFDRTLAGYQKDIHSFVSLLDEREYSPVMFLELSNAIPDTILALQSEKISSHSKKEVFLSLSNYLIQAVSDGAFNTVGRPFITRLNTNLKKSFSDLLVRRYRILHSFDIPFSYSSLPTIAFPYYRPHASSRPHTLYGPLILAGEFRERLLMLLWAFDFLVVFEDYSEVTDHQIDYIQFFIDELTPAAQYIGQLCGIIIGLFRPVSGVFADTMVLDRLGKNLEKYFGVEIKIASEDYLSAECDTDHVLSGLDCLYAMRFYDLGIILQVMDHWAIKAPNGPYSSMKKRLQVAYECFHSGTPFNYENSDPSVRHTYLTLFLANNRRIYKDDLSLLKQPINPFQIILDRDLSDDSLNFFAGALLTSFHLSLLRQNIICVYAALHKAFDEENVVLAKRIQRAFSNPIFSNTIKRGSQFFDIEVFTKRLPEWLAEHSR